MPDVISGIDLLSYFATVEAGGVILSRALPCSACRALPGVRDERDALQGRAWVSLARSGQKTVLSDGYRQVAAETCCHRQLLITLLLAGGRAGGE